MYRFRAVKTSGKDHFFLRKTNFTWTMFIVHHLGKCGDVILPRQRRGWSRAYSMCSPVAASDRRAPYEELIGAAGRREQMQYNAMVAS
jgi:hypothetical protein